MVCFAAGNDLLFYTATNSFELSTPLPTKVHTPCRALCGVASEWPQPWQGLSSLRNWGLEAGVTVTQAGVPPHHCQGWTSSAYVSVEPTTHCGVRLCSKFVFLPGSLSQREWCAHDGGIRKGEKDTPAGQCHPQNTRWLQLWNCLKKKTFDVVQILYYVKLEVTNHH